MVKYGGNRPTKIVSFKHKSGRVGGGVLSGDTIRRLSKDGIDDVLAYIESGGASLSAKSFPRRMSLSWLRCRGCHQHRNPVGSGARPESAAMAIAG